MRFRLLVLLPILLAALYAPGRAAACSQDDTAYFETFLDTSCLQQPLSNTTLDALGGLRLDTNGVPTMTSWDTDGDFVNGVDFESLLFAPLGVSTLAVSGTGSGAALTLPSTAPAGRCGTRATTRARSASPTPPRATESPGRRAAR